ncbi:MAG: ATP-binding protein [Thermosynechococcaceae cyanobacterium]
MFDQSLPCVTFERIQALFVEMSASLADPYALLTETDLSITGVDRFSVIVSQGFGALLRGALAPDGSHYKAQLIIDSGEISTFLKALPSPAGERLLALHNRRANRAKLQSQFATQVMQCLLVDLGTAQDAAVPVLTCQPIVDAALHQQVAQERLVHQVTSQIRQSLELAVILQTTVEEVRGFLQADRLVIYQFMDIETAADADDRHVMYEALSSDQITSVLHHEETYCWNEVQACRLKYSQGATLAIDDVEVHYQSSDCLLELLQTFNVRAKLLTPLIVKSELWGLLIAHQCSHPRQWQEHEKHLLQLIGGNLEIAIYQARLYGQLQQQKHTLEDQVEQRTQELHQAFVELQAANQAKGEFLATMSHELRTPLTCVIGMSATLLRWSLGPLSDKQKEYLQRIHDSGEQLLELINDILDFSNVESGKATLELNEFSLSSLTQQSLHLVRQQARTREVNLVVEVKVPLECDRFVADSRRIKQILFVLLDNAIQFTPARGTVTLRVWVESQTAIFQVEDTGTGIPIEQQSQLFQTFHQLDPSYHRTHEGTGLGLAMAKKFIDLHRGWIEVNSAEGQGSVFTVELPNQMQPNPLQVVPKPLGAHTPGGRIILVEDHEETANVLCDMLTAAGYQVIWTVDVSTAIEQARLLRPEVIIIDILQSAHDRLAMIRQLQKKRQTDPIKVLVTVSAQDALGLATAEVDAYLNKPIDPQYLVHRIDRLMTYTDAVI